MCLIQDLINRKNVLKLKLNSVWNKVHKLLPPKVDLELSLGSPLSILFGHGSRSISADNQLPATCVNLAQSDYDVSAIIKIEINKLRERFVHLWLKMKSHIQADFIAK